MTLRLSLAALIVTALALPTIPALARCSKDLVERSGTGLQAVAFGGERLVNAPSSNRATITFVGHASYQIDTPQGVRAITDYNGINGFGRHPDIVSMNNAHSTHYTDEPEEGITYILRGWPADGQTEARHDVTLKDMRVWNVPTNARDWDGRGRTNGNSIFVFEVRDLCSAHLRQLHQRLRPAPPEARAHSDVL